MPDLAETLTSLSQIPWWAGLLVLIFLSWLLSGGGRRTGWRPRYNPWSRGQTPDVADPAQQLTFVSRVAFERQPLLNKSEFQVLLVLEAVTRELRAGHRVMAQTSLGEILRHKFHALKTPETDLAFRSINSKRADFVIVDWQGFAVLAVEYQGRGHYQGTARLRDAVKREAFRSAGVALLEVPARFDKAEVGRSVRTILADKSDHSPRPNATPTFPNPVAPPSRRGH